MMGLFDGYDRDRGSSAEIARVLDIPVVLVVDAKSAAYSMTPLLQGFVNFRKDVRIAGVIFNKVGSEKHYQMLQQVCDDVNVKCLGYLPKRPELEQGSRYLGLDYSSLPESRELVSLLDTSIDWSYLRKLTVSSAETDGFSYRNRLFLRRKPAEYQDCEGRFKATLVDVEPDGRLVMIDEEGRERRYAFKEVQFVLR
jgi:cobyrinic acid a,c-diamide synthase